jgi:hypothetical protein
MQPVARYSFSINDRVILTEHGKRRFPHSPGSGTVVGFGREPTIVRILVDGTNTISNYHLAYWKRMRTDTQKLSPEVLPQARHPS